MDDFNGNDLIYRDRVRMLQYLMYLQLLQCAAGQAPAQVQPSCCSQVIISDIYTQYDVPSIYDTYRNYIYIYTIQVFLSSQGVLADTNSRALGIYTVSR